MNIKNIKYYIGLTALMFSVSLPAKAMKLNYFTKDILDVFNDATLILLSYAGKITLLLLIFGGVCYIMSGADPQKQESSKKVISYSILGLIFILASYAVVKVIEKVGTP